MAENGLIPVTEVTWRWRPGGDAYIYFILLLKEVVLEGLETFSPLMASK